MLKALLSKRIVFGRNSKRENRNTSLSFTFTFGNKNLFDLPARRFHCRLPLCKIETKCFNWWGMGRSKVQKLRELIYVCACVCICVLVCTQRKFSYSRYWMVDVAYALNPAVPSILLYFGRMSIFSISEDFRFIKKCLPEFPFPSDLSFLIFPFLTHFVLFFQLLLFLFYCSSI